MLKTTGLELVGDVARRMGVTVSPDEMDFILWERTGFPSFWDSDPETCCRQQVREYLGRCLSLGNKTRRLVLVK